MRQILQQAQKMQEELARTQAELSERRFEGSAGGGLVRAVVTGGPELVELSIDRSVVDPDDVAMLEDLVVAAVRQAVDAAVKAAGDEIGGLTGGLGDLLG